MSTTRYQPVAAREPREAPDPYLRRLRRLSDTKE